MADGARALHAKRAASRGIVRFLHSGKACVCKGGDGLFPAFPVHACGAGAGQPMFNHSTDKGTQDGRFQNRAKRIARRTERDNFRHFIMPAFYIFGAVGWFVYLMSFIYSELTGAEVSGFFAIAAGPTLLVGLMETYRFMRGHHSEALEEP